MGTEVEAGLGECLQDPHHVEVAGFCWTARLAAVGMPMANASAFCEAKGGSLAAPHQPGLLAYLVPRLALVHLLWLHLRLFNPSTCKRCLVPSS